MSFPTWSSLRISYAHVPYNLIFQSPAFPILFSKKSDIFLFTSQVARSSFSLSSRSASLVTMFSKLDCTFSRLAMWAVFFSPSCPSKRLAPAPGAQAELEEANLDQANLPQMGFGGIMSVHDVMVSFPIHIDHVLIAFSNQRFGITHFPSQHLERYFSWQYLALIPIFFLRIYILFVRWYIYLCSYL